MTDFEKQWIDDASYEQLFAKVRFEPVGSPWFTGETGAYLMERWGQLRDALPPGEHSRISKKIGWNHD